MNIIPLFKVQEPFMEVKDGHGYLGVVMTDTDADKLQCHICGGWYSMLPTHIKRAHDVMPRDYRETYGLPMSVALCSKAVSAAHRKNVIDNPELAARGSKNLKSHRPVFSRKKRSDISRRARLQMSAKNKVGLCDAQMAYRYRIVAEMVGHPPITHDLEKHDAPLLAAIGRRGTLNSFRKSLGELERGRGNFAPPPVDLIAALRKWSQKNKRHPSSTEWMSTRQKPCVQSILRAFGSWHQALQVAGLR